MTRRWNHLPIALHIALTKPMSPKDALLKKGPGSTWIGRVHAAPGYPMTSTVPSGNFDDARPAVIFFRRSGRAAE